MSETGQDRSGRLLGDLAGMIRLAHTALGEATAALLDTADTAAENATAAEKALYELREEIEDDASALLLDGSPTADLRTIVVGVHVGTDVECLAALARQLVALAWARQSGQPMPARLRLPLRGMGNLALTMVAMAGDVLESTESETVADLLGGMHEIAQRQRLLYDQMLSEADQAEPGDVADATLLSCCYERCASHAVSMARHAAFFADSKLAG
ncbi:PhoU domain-containing protein [Kitasatospora sp. NPDC050543]|uniref:PhoU domain-containing protein n=1 Tax=Kitasatospora sp. NPDC050543 TaxID=3364054 RepID=UPI003795FE40